MRKLLSTLLIGLTLLTYQTGYAQNKGKATIKKVAPITVKTPARPVGQKDVINLVTPKLETVRVGFIGLGMRGPGAVARFTKIPGTQVVALCDIRPESVEKTQQILKKAGLPEAASYSGTEDAWKQLCDRDDIDLVYIATDWKHHADMGVYAMEKGKHVAIEVPAAMTLDEIWKLINTSERTRKHCMQLENCVYDFFELTSLNMAQQGIFGEVLHVEGAYIHNLEEFWPSYWNNWRMDYNRKYRGDVYATHGIGPACQLLDIHRGDRLKTLVAMDTKAVNGPAYIKSKTGEEVKDFQNGDQTSTLIRTENGKTMLIQHNVMTPRPYSRMYQVTGTDGYASKYPIEEYCLRPSKVSSEVAPDHEKLNAHGSVPQEVKKALMEKYKHPIHVELEETAKKVGGHGGMDYIMDYRLVYCLRNGLPLDMDVYDLAEWCSMAELTRISIENNSNAVAIPDFTRGGWNKVKGYKHAFAQ
ncbi:MULTISPECIES: Gfo/Idh/MocA family protein [Bacteroides]|uniref:Gfo/Idh/MocA family protein n=1 Tax=Bacteroides TaxID=816 RepID=UPI0004B25FFD|nr:MULTISPECIES: Gfo/Idh/MocA family oxidoreductase [Bacteroides]MBP6065939.1 Gfo/Idh/MocA family oxidoreductase [Bacteroides sp.]MBP6066654.1 Gfo/Idh/MocA family oxidoreductase [Bacteroides sp.]MBP6936985.1 Gfo/Idh/MocA family oxidoreductase [Bacteroides sp.]MBP8621545.1 Gfo/Idh/MocA family oxidoreductase [Bacteroides sp.]MBP9585925.1 Gfo/Idh/MocA family oxidoreductase [Bacteroides sp.]